MPVDVSRPMPANTSGLVLAEGRGSGDVGLQNEVVSSNVGKLEFTLAIVLVDEIHSVTGIMKIVVIGIRVPCVLVTAVTSMGLSTSPVVSDVVGLHTLLGTGAINLGGIPEDIVLGQAELGDKLGTEDGTASRITDIIHKSLSPPPKSTLQSSNRLPLAFNKHLTTVVTVNKSVTDSAITVPGLFRGVETSVEVVSDFVVIVIDLSLETNVVDTVGSGLLARLTSQCSESSAVGALAVDAINVILFVALELHVLISPSHLTVKVLEVNLIIVVGPTSTSNSPRTIEVTPIASVSLGKGRKADGHKG